jgi:PAS domain S-box-containing protein
MSDQAFPTASQPNIAASGQGLLDHHVFHHAVEMTRMAMALADPNLPDCPLVYVNPAFCALTGYTPDDVLGRNCRFLQGSKTEPDTIQRIRDAVAAREGLDIEIYNYRKNGLGFWNSLHLSPIFDDTGRLIYYFSSQIDVSAQKEATRRQAQRIESVGALASGVAHEFNNLMTIVVGNVERAVRRVTDDRQEHYLNRVSAAARRAGQLAGELLSLAQRQTRKERIIDLNEVVRSMESKLTEAVGQDLRIRLDLAPSRLLAEVDTGQLELVLLSLVSNAADAMIGHGEIIVATRVLSASAATSVLNGEAAVELAVIDTGTGMSPEVARRATELFFTTKTKAAGLGLFGVLEFADHCGAKMAIETEAGQGTTIRMAFPRMAER